MIREESLAVMRILEKVIFGHQSNLITIFVDGIRNETELIFHRVYRFPSRAVDEREQSGLGKWDFDAFQSFPIGRNIVAKFQLCSRLSVLRMGDLLHRCV